MKTSYLIQHFIKEKNKNKEPIKIGEEYYTIIPRRDDIISLIVDDKKKFYRVYEIINKGTSQLDDDIDLIVKEVPNPYYIVKAKGTKLKN